MGIYLVCVALALYHRNKNTYIYFKTLTSLTFVMTGIYYGFCEQNYILIPLLIGFLIGDILLATKLRRNFIYGMGGFFLADVWLIYALYQIRQVTIFDFILSVLVILFVNIVSKNPKMHLGHYKKPMYGYGVIISLAVSNSIGCFLQYGSRNYLLLSIGMVFYLISDFLLMYQYFYTTKHRDKLKIAKMLFYFTGAYMIACSVGV